MLKCMQALVRTKGATMYLRPEAVYFLHTCDQHMLDTFAQMEQSQPEDYCLNLKPAYPLLVLSFKVL